MTGERILHLRGQEMFSVSGVPLHVFRMRGFESLRHTHDFHELMLVTEGAGEHQLFSPDGEMYEAVALQPGDLFAIPLTWSHAYRSRSGLQLYNITFDSQLVKGLDSEEGRAMGAGELRALAGSEPARWHLRRGELEQAIAQLQSLARELIQKRAGYILSAWAKLVEFLVWTERLRIVESTAIRPELAATISESIDFMERHLAEPIRVNDVAKHVHFNANYFSELFRQAMGVSPGRYLMKLRLDHARYLLLESEQSVAVIARESGFEDPSYFSRAFRAAYGISPTALREAGAR